MSREGELHRIVAIRIVVLSLSLKDLADLGLNDLAQIASSQRSEVISAHKMKVVIAFLL